ncbi:MAG: molybdenum cofactor guanylyltransferase [Rubrobacteridae bacterium]|nr:molybdenum cofactor guanylyltransferase [Rubrobacteridae bacterium]
MNNKTDIKKDNDLKKGRIAGETGMPLKEMGAIILAGGKSSRMGRDKNTVILNGEPMLLRAVHTLRDMFGEVIIALNQDIPLNISDVKIVRDKIPHLGPLGRINAGLNASKYETNFVVAVDMPF